MDRWTEKSHTPHCKGQGSFWTGQLRKYRNRLWNEDGVYLKTKIDVYRAVLLYSAFFCMVQRL